MGTLGVGVGALGCALFRLERASPGPIFTTICLEIVVVCGPCVPAHHFAHPNYYCAAFAFKTSHSLLFQASNILSRD
jgi:hypothetical protein